MLPEGATILPIMAASDKTPVTSHTGGLEMHPLFLTTGNIQSDVRMKATSHAWNLVCQDRFSSTILLGGPGMQGTNEEVSPDT